MRFSDFLKMNEDNLVVEGREDKISNPRTKKTILSKFRKARIGTDDRINLVNAAMDMFYEIPTKVKTQRQADAWNRLFDENYFLRNYKGCKFVKEGDKFVFLDKNGKKDSVDIEYDLEYALYNGYQEDLYDSPDYEETVAEILSYFFDPKDLDI